MVLSEINRTIEYHEDSAIDPVDNDISSLIYPIEIAYDENGRTNTKKYKIAFGRINKDHEKKYGILYYPIYLVARGEALAKIGILEVEDTQYSGILDADGDIKPDKMPEPLLFSFVNDVYLDGLVSVDESADSDTSEDESSVEEASTSVKKTHTDHDNLFDVDVDISARAEEKGEPIPVKKEKPDAIFKQDTNTKMPAMLTEESKKDADKIREEYQESTKNEWIENFMKNNLYKIVDNEGGGDCLFAVVRDAFKQIGQITTVEKLREVLADAATDELYQQYRGIYLSMENSIKENESEMKTSMNQMKIIKKRIQEKTADRTESQKLLSDAKVLKKRIEELNQDNKDNKKFLEYNFGFMQNIDSLKKLQDFIKTSSYWADVWAISTLEEKLNFKFIIFSEESFEETALDSVLQCGDSTQNIKQQGTFKPNYYIMTSYSGQHYRLITYKDKRIFNYREIPYDVKMLVINKCMERNSGVFDMIPDFKNLKAKIGIDATDQEAENEQESEMDAYMTSLFDPDIVFVLGASAPTKVYPGEAANGEHIPKDKKSTFIKLSKVPSWRRKLHDSCTEAPFTLDGHRWASVEHYYQGAKFKKQHPDYYVKFSLDHPSDLSQKVDVARLAGGKDGKRHRDKKYTGVTIDPDFYGGRNLEERARAIEAKFDQNEDLKQTLIMTAPAKLMNFVRRSKLELNEPLMSIRKKFQE